MKMLFDQILILFVLGYYGNMGSFCFESGREEGGLRYFIVFIGFF